MKSILFVCLGNICRSPLAEGFARKYIKDNKLCINVDSAGTANYHVGENPCTLSQQIALKNGVNISQLKARQVKTSDEQIFDFIVVMDESNKINMKKMGFDKVYKLGDFGYEGLDVPDPYYEQDQIQKVYDMVECCVTNFIKQKLS